MENPQILIIVVIIILVIIGAIFGAYLAKLRRDNMQKLANKWGCRFTPSKNWSFDEQYSSFGLLRKGSNRYAYNIIEGMKDGYHIKAFDYHYETYSTNSKGHRQTHHHHFSAVIYHTGLPIQPLFIRPESFFDRITEFMGFDDIDFESAEFSKKFYVKSPNKKWAYDVIHQETMEFLLAAPRYTIEFYTPNVIVYKGGRLSTDEFEQAMYVVEGIIQRFPKYLLQELKGESA